MIKRSSNTTILFLLIMLMHFLIARDDERKTLVGAAAPNWALKTTDGKFEFLNNYVAPESEDLRSSGSKLAERQIVVQSFFASWCQPCIKEIGELHKLKRDYSNRPVKFFLVDLTDFFRQSENSKYKKAKSGITFLTEKGLTDITVLKDNRGIIAGLYGVSGILPRLFVIDKYQVVRKDEQGLCPSCIRDELSGLIDKLLEE